MGPSSQLHAHGQRFACTWDREHWQRCACLHTEGCAPKVPFGRKPVFFSQAAFLFARSAAVRLPRSLTCKIIGGVTDSTVRLLRPQTCEIVGECE